METSNYSLTLSGHDAVRSETVQGDDGSMTTTVTFRSGLMMTTAQMSTGTCHVDFNWSDGWTWTLDSATRSVTIIPIT